ncbi:MAG TPA: DUF3473 domain-containing protein [Candidatus Magasanikbacteria bacterium]|nr:DUF3473 domain-containing protein [Candidatus Magasanikbacteria bacterium]
MLSNKKIILIIFLAFTAASIVAIKFLPNFPVISDSADYDQTALNIIKTKHYLPVADNIYYPPIYPFVLSTIYFIFGHNYLAVYLIHLIFLLIISFFTYKIAYIYFRLFPLKVFTSLLKKTPLPFPVLYLHPHELCAQTPKISGPWLKTYFKYFGINKSLKKFEQLSNHFIFQSIEKIFNL